MRRTRRSILAGLAASVPGMAWAARRSKIPTGPPSIPPQIVSVTPTTGGFLGGTGSANTPIMTMIATMSPMVPAFTGTWSITGPDASLFVIDVSTGVLSVGAVDVAVGTYNLSAVATQVGATGSPFTQAISVVGSAGELLATMTLVNTSATVAQPSGFVTPMFGWNFHKGHIPSGTAPTFKNGSLPQPYSWGCQSYWSDGSLKNASFMMICLGSTVPAGGSIAIGVWSGGTAPTTSARTAAEVYTEAIQVNLVGQGSTFGLTGTWGAWLTSDVNNAEQFVYLDGDAGKVWRFLTHVAPTQGGTKHGQMECYHYVAALTNDTGGLGGFRYLPCLAQPWYDVNSPAKASRSFSTINWQHGAGPTTVPYPLYYTPQTWTQPLTTHALSTVVFTGGSLASLTFSGGVVTATTVLPHGLSGVTRMGIAGVTPSNYNGSFACTVTGASTFTYPISSSPTSPATIPGTYGFVTATAAAPHGFGIATTKALAIQGNTPSGYDTTAITCTVTTTTAFNYPLGVNPGTNTVAGTYFLNTTTVTSAGATTAFYTGDAANQFCIPVRVSSSGTLPPPLDANTLYSCRGTKTGTTTVNFTTVASTAGSPLTMTGPGSGTLTITPLPTLYHFGRMFMPTTDARWNFFQGAGSYTAEPTIRTVIDRAYWNGDSTNKLSLINPWDMTLTGVVNYAADFSWAPQSIGKLYSARSSGGGTDGRLDLGAMTGYQGSDFFNQSAASDTLNRIHGFAAALDHRCFRNSTNGNCVNLRGSGHPHTGMTANSTIRYVADHFNSNTGFTSPPTANTNEVFDQSNNTHSPAFTYWPFLRTGEPQFLDMLLEWGIGAILDCDPNSRNTLAGQPAAYTAVGIFSGSGGERQVAWGNRGVHTAAAVCPLVMPDSSDIHGCLSGMSDDTCAVSLAVYTSNILGTYASTNGLFGPYGGPATGGPTIYQDSFQSTYTRMAMCLAAGARENPDALVILQKMADWHAYLVSKFGYYYTTGYFNKTGMANTDINVGWPAISVDEQYATTTPFVASWTTSSPNWTLVRATAGNGAVVRDGDRFMFEKNPPLPPPISVTLNSPTNYLRDTPYYAINTIAVNATTYTCNMTTVLGSAGNILVPAAPGSGGANATYHWYVGQDVAPAIGAENTGYQNQGSYMSWKRSSHLWMKALGITGLDAAITDAGLRFDHAGFLAVVRGAFQDHFGA